MSLPASGAAKYNLVAHDGKYGEWRTWANGVLPPVRTTPGQAIDGVTLSLTRPATVRGKVVDAKGRPLADREVYARPADDMENRYYDPTATTAADGTFTLRFLRPGTQLLRVYGGTADDAPATVALKPGETADGVTLRAAEQPDR